MFLVVSTSGRTENFRRICLTHSCLALTFWKKSSASLSAGGAGESVEAEAEAEVEVDSGLGEDV